MKFSGVFYASLALSFLSIVLADSIIDDDNAFSGYDNPIQGSDLYDFYSFGDQNDDFSTNFSPNNNNYNNNDNYYGNSEPQNDYNNDNNDAPYQTNSYYNNQPYTSTPASTSTTTMSPTPTPPGSLTCGRPKNGQLDPFGLGMQTPPATLKAIKNMRNLLDQDPNFDTIVGGLMAQYGQICWQANLLDSTITDMDQGYCGGSILTAEWILTAAHCVANANATDLFITTQNLFVSVGNILSIANDTGDGEPNCIQTIQAAQIIVFPGFQRNLNKTVYRLINDIALIKLATPIDFHNNCTCPICLSSQEPFTGELGAVSGFGCQTQDCTNEAFPSMLDWTQAREVPDDAVSCQLNSTEANAEEARRVIFCGGGNPGIGPCQGDSGGPYVFWDPRRLRYYQAGITSYGNGDNGFVCAGTLSTRFTQVDQFFQFITQNVPGVQFLRR